MAKDRNKFPEGLGRKRGKTHARTSRQSGNGGHCDTIKSPEAKTAFIAVLASPTGSVHKACQAIGISRTLAYKWRDDDPEFREAWVNALEDGIDALESEARRRGFQGVETPIFNKDGHEIGTKVDYSDALLSLVLKGRRNSVFGNKTELSGPGGAAIQHEVTVRFVKAEKEK